MVGAIVLNGEKFNGAINADIIVACDGGYNKCDGVCDIVVGDMDSVVGDIAKPSIVLNPDKDLTDGEFAVSYLVEKNVSEVHLYGLDGGRLDHILANIGLMSQLVKAGVKAVCYCNGFTGYMVNDSLDIDVCVGSTISLSPFTDNVHIMLLRGVKWQLDDITLLKESSLTMSNVATSNRLRLDVASGEVLVIVNR